MQTRDVKAAVDALAATFGQFKAANDEALAQKADRGAVDALTEAKVARLDGEIERLRDGLDRTRASLNRPARGAAPGFRGDFPGDPRVAEHKAAFGAYLRHGDDAGLALIEKKALSVGSDPEAGYLVTPRMSETIVATVFETSPVRAVAAAETISSDSLEMLVYKDEAAAGWVAEAEARLRTAEQ